MEEKSILFITTHHLLLLTALQSPALYFRVLPFSITNMEQQEFWKQTHTHIPYTFQIQNSTAHPSTQRRKTGSGCHQAVQLHHWEVPGYGTSEQSHWKSRSHKMQVFAKLTIKLKWFHKVQNFLIPCNSPSPSQLPPVLSPIWVSYQNKDLKLSTVNTLCQI